MKKKPLWKDPEVFTIMVGAAWFALLALICQLNEMFGRGF